jgi:predicted small metal-binding protein
VPRLSCSQIGGDCEFVTSGGTADEVKRELLAHMEDVHRQRASRMSADEREILDIRIDQVLRRHDHGGRAG